MDWAQVPGLLTGMAAIAALIFTALSLEASRDQIAVSEQGQITERFSRAVEQLGSAALDVRLGGIYSLERIMRDSSRDQSAILDVLATFVRVHAPLDSSVPAVYSPSEPRPAIDFKPPVADVQAALTVLGRRNPSNDGPVGSVIDLSRTNLRFANLAGGYFARVNLEGADLARANLSEANLTSAYAVGANLLQADLRGADLSGANLVNAYIYGGNQEGASFSFVEMGDITAEVVAEPNSGQVYDCEKGVEIKFTAEIHSTWVGRMSYHWERSDGAVDGNRYPPLVFTQSRSNQVATTTWMRFGDVGDELHGWQMLK